MYVCVCLAVSDKEVARVIREGATTVDAVTKACRAGGDCGACRGMIADMIEDQEPCSRRSLPLMPVVPAGPKAA